MTYMAVVREADTVQVWDADIGASVLHPHIRSYSRLQNRLRPFRVKKL
jgi:hypothetical protein